MSIIRPGSSKNVRRIPYRRPASVDFCKIPGKVPPAGTNALPLRAPPMPRPLLFALSRPDPAPRGGGIFLRLVVDRFGTVFRISHSPAGVHLIEIQIDAIKHEHTDGALVFVAGD